MFRRTRMIFSCPSMITLLRTISPVWKRLDRVIARLRESIVCLLHCKPFFVYPLAINCKHMSLYWVKLMLFTLLAIPFQHIQCFRASGTGRGVGGVEVFLVLRNQWYRPALVLHGNFPNRKVTFPCVTVIMPVKGPWVTWTRSTPERTRKQTNSSKDHKVALHLSNRTQLLTFELTASPPQRGLSITSIIFMWSNRGTMSIIQHAQIFCSVASC